MSNEAMANQITDVPSAIAELLALNKQLEKELQETKAQLEKAMIRCSEIEDTSRIILKGLDKGISTVQNSIPHANLKFYFQRYPTSARVYFEYNQGGDR